MIILPKIRKGPAGEVFPVCNIALSEPHHPLVKAEKQSFFGHIGLP